jgi:hypothetical protein
MVAAAVGTSKLFNGVLIVTAGDGQVMGFDAVCTTSLDESAAFLQGIRERGERLDEVCCLNAGFVMMLVIFT